MDKDSEIKEVVQRFVKAEKMFTSIDIGNTIKKETCSMSIRNRDVRDWLKTNISYDPILLDYVQEPIDLPNGGVATLYRPHWKDAEDYKDRDQKAFGPADITPAPAATSQTYAPINGALTMVANISKPIASTGNVGINPTPTTIVNQPSVVKLVSKCRNARRIQIPADFSKYFGWVPGQKVDVDKIKIHQGKLGQNLKVWYDGRFSISRKVVGFDNSPVSIVLKNDAIYFEKA